MKTESALHILLKPSILFRFFFLLLAFGFLSTKAMVTGDTSGKKTIEGIYPNSIGITFVWKGEAPTDIEGKQLVLILHHEDKYYVVEKAIPAPASPRVYIVPDELVRYASR